MSEPVSALLRAAALGAASGCRSTAGMAAVALSSSPTDRGPLASRLGGRAGTVTTALMAAGEVIADKLPAAPPRTFPPALLVRAGLGATSAVAVTRRDGGGPALPALVAFAAALGTSVLGVRVRAAAARRLGSDLPAAVAEDALAALLGWLGTRRPT